MVMAESAEVFMNVPEVQNIAKKLKDLAQVLQGIRTALEIFAKTLHAAAFFSFGATEAQARFLDRINPQLKKQEEKLEQLSTDVGEAIKAYIAGDTSGKSRFA
jgi:Holliday junction resolvasome RuvABC ATP-dependent DNA helicase subunit